MTPKERLDAVVAVVRRYVPQYKLVYKSDSRLQKAIGWVMGKLGNDAYMERFWTTIGYTTYRPSITDINEWSVIAHEGMHAMQARRFTRPLMGLLYLLPQALVLLALLAFWKIWFLAALVLVLPVPAYFRKRFEMKAYFVSLATWRWAGYPDVQAPYIVNHFLDGDYYFMWPFRQDVIQDVADAITSLDKTGMVDVPPYAYSYVLELKQLISSPEFLA